jgi:Flp pilus assembly protein TadB
MTGAITYNAGMIAKLKTWAGLHPKLAAWLFLAIGMVVILIIAARDVGLLWNQWLFLILATIGLAGLCVWIIGWESDSDEDEETSSQQPAAKS